MPEVSISQAMDLALEHQKAGRFAEAADIYQRVLAIHPDHPDALHLLGVVAHDTGNPSRALELVGRAVALAPQQSVFRGNLALILSSVGRKAEAETQCRHGLALAPNVPELHAQLGLILKSAGNREGALACFKRALEINPRYASGYSDVGNLLSELGRLREAATWYRKGLAVSPNDVAGHNNLGTVLADIGDVPGAIECYKRALAINPNIAAIHNNMGNALKEQGLLDDAIISYERALALEPKFTKAINNLANGLKDQGRMEEAIEYFRRAAAAPDAMPDMASNLLYTMALTGQDDGRMPEYGDFNARYVEPLRGELQPHANSREPDRILRIGYVSPDFYDHALSRFLMPLLQHHDRRNVNVFCYADIRKSDAMTQTYMTMAMNWRPTIEMTDARFAEQVRVDGIDILVDLAMHAARNRMLVFARKPAPVQVSYLAYCGTTGLKAIDYRLSDRWLDPPGMDEGRYIEKTYRLPRTYWCCEPYPGAPPVSSAAPVPGGVVTFGCLNNFSKVSVQAFETWAVLLRELPSSRMIIHSGLGSHRQRTQAIFARCGVDPARVQFVGRQPTYHYLQIYQQIDIALDPFPYAGGTTTCDALWMGCPVITLNGPTAGGRGGVSILNTLGLPDLIAQSPREYVDLAVKLARDPARIAALRQTLRQRMAASPLLDAAAFTRDLENAFREMWRTWCAGSK